MMMIMMVVMMMMCNNLVIQCVWTLPSKVGYELMDTLMKSVWVPVHSRPISHMMMMMMI